MENNTVTIDLEKYESMKNEIKNLRKQVKEKTIYKEYLPTVWGYVVLFMLVIIMHLLIFYTREL